MVSVFVFRKALIISIVVSGVVATICTAQGQVPFTLGLDTLVANILVMPVLEALYISTFSSVYEFVRACVCTLTL